MLRFNAFEIAASRPWLILPSSLSEILTVADRMGDPEALASRVGRPLTNTRTVERRDSGVAVIPVVGPIFRYANLLTEISGATSTQVLATDIQAAIDDRSVRGIVLDVNSPGGEATGIHELAQLIFDARAKKPIWAYVGGTGASAAYWIASAAERVLVDATALLGSIGVVMTYRDERERQAKSGVKTIEIVSSSSPDKRLDPDTERGRTKVQQLVDDMAGVFVSSVARNRGVSAETVTNDFGRGGLLMGAAAVSAGMVDGVASLESAITALAGSASPSRGIYMSQTKGTVSASSATELRTALKEATDEQGIETRAAIIRSVLQAERESVLSDLDTRVKSAIATERSRVAAIHSIAPSGFEKERDLAIADGSTAESFSLHVLKTQKDRGVSLEQLKVESQRAPHATAPPGAVLARPKVSATEIYANRAKAGR
jgi:signal peptide peptidase SppA